MFYMRLVEVAIITKSGVLEVVCSLRCQCRSGAVISCGGRIAQTKLSASELVRVARVYVKRLHFCSQSKRAVTRLREVEGAECLC